MEWQISVWLEFAQKEACIRVKKKIKQGTVDQKKLNPTSLISQTDQSYTVSWRKENAFHCYFA